MSNAPTIESFTDLDKIVTEIIAPNAVEIDQTGSFPRAALDAMGKAGLLGLISAPEVGGRRQSQPRWLLNVLPMSAPQPP